MRCGLEKWRPVLGVMALGVFACSVTLYAEPKTDGAAPRLQSKGADRIVAGSGIPSNAVLPVFAPITVDYRNDEGNVFMGGGLTAIGGSAFTVWEPSAGMSRAETECRLADHCVRCQSCIAYACEEGDKCSETPQTGWTVAGCDDAQYCNGDEYCNAGTCEPGTSPCTGDDVCDEVADECYPACQTNEDCDDEDECTRDTCDVVSGLCTHEDICTDGRCCVGNYPNKECHVANLDECDVLGGRFLATADPCVVVQPSGNTNDCPKYSAGIAPQGDYVTEIGPVSWLPCDYFYEIGDDYVTQNVDADPEVEGYFEVTFLRFVGGIVEPGSVRWSVNFYDANGIWIENVFWPDGTNDSSAVGIRTVDFDPPLIIPHHGYVVFRVQANFGPAGRFVVVTTDCPPDKGENDCTAMWIDGDPNASWLGECVDGDRDGKWCDYRNMSDDCTDGGTCVPIPHVLAMELVGEKTSIPEEACCTAEGDCKMELPWVCKDEGSKPQGPGTLCGYCDENSPDPGLPCTPDQEPDECDPGVCLPIPACETQACCNVDTGECIEVEGIGTPCPSPTVPQGYGTDCDPNCCVQPPSSYTGNDNCRDVYTHLIQVPSLGADPVVLTITGNNTGATYDEYPDICDDSIFNPAGGTRDPGWWESFTITACAEVRMEFCCSVTYGPDPDAWRPNWANLWNSCNPCEGTEGNAGVDPPIGIGRGTSGYARGLPFCSDDNLWMTFGPIPAGQYYYPMYSAPDGTGSSPPGQQYQLNIHVGACPIAACCTGSQCEVVNELVCRERDGYWMYGVVDCGSDPNCTLPPGETDNPCCTGSCCVGPGECEDEYQGQAMDEELCQIRTGESGNYVGGPACENPNHLLWPAPCPVCDVIGDANCQMPNLFDDDQSPVMSDRGCFHGVLLADDFIPTEDGLSTVCVWGAYLDRYECDAETDDCDCNDEVPDDFLVRVYNDAGGIPGTVLVEGAPDLVIKGPVDATFGPTWYTGAQMYEFQLMFDNALTGMVPGETYWLEVSNDLLGTAGEEATDCCWHWQITDEGKNNYSAIGTNKGYGNGNERGTYRTPSQRAADASFCLNMNIGDPIAPNGGCCDREGALPPYTCLSTCTTTTLQMCDGPWYRKNADCASPCPTTVPGDVCAVNPIEVWDDPKFEHFFNTWCANTDGPPQVMYELGMGGMGSDIWVHYNSPCEGRVTVDTCANGQRNTSFDGALAVYMDAVNPSVCPCPGDPGFSLIGTAMDENCNGIADAGSGVVFPPPVSVGDCLTVRVGGYDAEFGPGTLKIGCEAVICTPVKPPEPNPILADLGFGTRNRYISFVTKDLEGLGTAIRVTFVSLPPPNDQYNGDQWFVGEPVLLTEASGSSGPVPPPTIWAAPLQCGTPYYTDWSRFDTVYVYHGGIINGSTYHLQKVADDCNPANENSYSEPLVVVTSLFGDVCGTSPSASPQGVIDFVDISAVVGKFKNAPGAILKSRADITGNGPNDPYPNRKIDFVDISACVDCFRNQPPRKPGPQVHCP